MLSQNELRALVEPLFPKLAEAAPPAKEREPKKIPVGVDPEADGRLAGRKAAEIFRRALNAN